VAESVTVVVSTMVLSAVALLGPLGEPPAPPAAFALPDPPVPPLPPVAVAVLEGSALVAFATAGVPGPPVPPGFVPFTPGLPLGPVTGTLIALTGTDEAVIAAAMAMDMLEYRKRFEMDMDFSSLVNSPRLADPSSSASPISESCMCRAEGNESQEFEFY
jgi:hypothetical protein